MGKYGYWVLIILILFVITNSFLTRENIQENSFSEGSNKSGIQEEIKVSELEPQEEVTNEGLDNVIYVVDGDTLEIDTGERVRLICIDTPERGEEGYQEAKEYLQDLVLNKNIKLEKDISDTDRYDRLLRYIYLEDGTFVNELIVKNGYAEVYPYNPDTTLCPIIEEAEDYAKNKEIGIWEIKIEVDVVEEITTEESNPIQDIDCGSNLYNCGDFSTCSEVMEVFNACSYDIHYLDGDDDGIPCESLC